MIKRMFSLVTALVIGLLVLAGVLSTLQSVAVEAYPAPPSPLPPASYPGPGQPTSQLPQPPSSPPINLNYKTYLPVVVQPCPFRFGIGGADQEHTTPIIPDCAVDGYKWELSPNPDSTVQMVRRCQSHEGVSQQYLCWIDNNPIFHFEQ